MIPGAFTYYAAETVPEAVTLLHEHPDDAKVLAGGQSLIPLMRLRLAEPQYIVDINRIANLAGVTLQGDTLVIGALTREVDLERDPLFRRHFPILVETTEVIADPLVRNLATVGGNLTHADPANDHPATMLVLGAEVVAQGPNGERVVPIDDLFVDTFMTALEPDELLTAIRVPLPLPRTGGAYVKFERKVGDYAIAATAARVTLNEDGTIGEARIALTNAFYKPMRAMGAEAALRGREPTEAVIREAAAAASAEAEPGADLRGPVEYKRAMVRTMTTRAVQRAVERARAAS